MVSEQKSPGFLKDLEEVQEDAGARIRLECRVSGRPKPSVSWTKDGNSIHVSSRVRIIEAYTSHTLLISRAESADSGVYAVTVTNQHGHETSTARVDINGTSAVSSRNYSPSPKPSVVSSARKIEIKSNAGAAAAGSRLDKTAASRLVTGNIWTRNSATAASGISSSTGGAPPRRRGPGFILRPKPKTVKVGESLNLKCTLLGHPKPTVTWEKNGELVDEERTDGHIQTSIDGNNYFLEIDRCKAEDGGKYAVTARNSLGKQMASVEVTITEGGAVSAATPSAKIPASPAAPPSKIAAAPATVTEVKREIKRTTNGDDVTNNNSSNTPQQQTTTSTTSTITSKMLITTSTKTTGNDNNNVPASPTGSVSSSLSVQSRQSSASSRSTHSVPEDHNGRAAVAANSTVLLISSPAPSSTAEQKQQKQQQQQEGRSVGAVDITRASTKKLLTLHAPTITRRLSSTQVLEGEELLLQCVISGDPEPELQWLRNGVEFNENQVFVSFRNGVARLRLRDVQLRHAGEYMCVARNDGGEVKCSSRVTVKAKPINKCPRFIKSPCDVRAVEGETLKLEAEVEGSPTPEIFWSIDGQEIQDADSSFINNVANLIIKNVTVSNTGQYMCNAINAGGEDSVACRVRIKEPKLNIRPEFTAPLTDVTVKKDETLCLRCMVTGIPEPSVSWYCDNQMIDDLEGVEVTFQDGVAGLSLDKVQGDDSGVYSCVAVNSEGEGKTSCDVIVQEDEPEPEPEPEPAPPVVVAPTPQPVQVVQPMPQPEPKKLPSVAPKFTQRFDEFIRTQEGDEVTLKCCFIASPEPTVTWMAGGKPVEGAQESQEPGKACITIPAISSTHSGSVRCVVSNGVGTIEHETRLSVRSRRTAPTIEKELPPTLVIEEGETAEIDCIVHGHPQPRVSWIRDNRSLSILSTETTYENGRATVKIRRATQRDSGRYVCTARNLSGDVETCCKVTVIAKAPEEEEKPKEEAKPVITIPTFVRELSDVELEDGQDLKLVCEVSGEPQPKIHWRVDDEPLDVDDSETTYQNGMASLFLEDVMQEDSGRYACVAENEAGKSQSSCMVKVNAATNGATEQKEPSFVVQLKDHSVKEGDDIKLTCTITGNPVPEVTWLLDGEEIVDAELRSDEDGVHELFLAESLPDDEGVYTCIAHNSLKRVMSSCKVTIDALESLNGGTGDQIPIDDEVRQPEFVKALSDSTIADGSKGYRLTCHVSGCPEPKATWYFGEDEILPCDDFQLVQEGQTRSLIFTEVFPEDTGDYACVIKNRAGAAKSSARITVEEIDGEAPNFLNKPRPVTANIGEIAIFSCQVDGDPAPAVSWICNGHDLTSDDHVRMIDGCADNNFTNSLEIDQVTALDAGRYSVTCSNLLGNITCTVSLIVNDAKQQETRTDFRDVLKKGSKSPTSASQNSKEQTGTGEEQVDFRGVLRKTSTGGEVPRKTASSESDDSKEAAGSMYKEALNTQVKTKSITEDERKKQKAEQVDFRSSLVRKVDTKITNQDELKVRQPEQQDFRDEALRTHVLTKQIGQDEIKKMQAEQVDFRAEAIKTKVVTKAYKEELVKTRKVEQVDFRTVLSPTKKESDDAFTSPVTSPTTNMTNIAEIPRGKWKRSEVHNNNTVVTKRSRNRGGSQAGTERKSSRKSEDAAPEEEVPMKPEFREELEDIEISEGGPFQLVCYVSGNPRPEVKWSIDDVELKAEDEFEIEYKGGRCSLSMGESLPDDEGIYTCRAVNVHGEAVTSASVTCSTAAPPSDRDDDDDVDDDVIDDDETPTNSPTKVEMPSIRIPVTPPPAVKMTEEKIKTPTTLATKANQRSISTITLTARATDKTEKTTKSFKLVPVKSEPTVNVNKTTSNGHGRPVTASKSEVTIRSSVTSPKPSKSAESKPTSANGRLETPEKPSVLLQIRLRSAQVSWKGVKKIRGLSSLYTIEERQEKTKKDDSRARVPEKKIWKAAASTIHTSYTFTNLREEVNYYYRIIANNNNNTSEPSEESEAVSLPAKQQMSTIRKSTSATMSYTLPQTPAAASRRFSCDNVTRLETHKLRGLPVTSVTSAIRKSTASGGGGILRTSTPLKTQNPATGGAREAKTSPTHKPSQSKADVTSSGDRTGGKKTTETKAVTSSVAVVSTKLQVSKKREEKKKGPEAAVNNGGMKIQDQINSLLLDGGKDEKIFHISMPNPDNLSSDSRSRRNKGDPQQQRGVRDDQQVSPLRKVREVPVLKSVLRNKSAVTPTTSSSSATSTDLFKKPLPPAEYAGSHRKASLVARNSVETSEGSTTVDEDQSDDGESRNFVKLPPVQIKYDEKFLELYDIHERLGQGRFGIVHRVTSRRNGRDYAAKIMRALKMKDQSSVQTEIEVMNLLRHPKLVQLVAAFSHGREITMVMECVSGGELFERVVDEDFELTERICVEYIRQICEGVGFMHDTSIIHLDLKPENILCVNKTGTKIKLIDFGLARKFDPKETTKVLLGTPEFVAPEVVNFDSIGFPTDMWSVGVICYILLSGLSPFAGDSDSETYTNITAVRWDFEDEAFDQISEDAKDFICHLLVKNMSQRFDFKQALGHAWLRRESRASKEDTKRLNTKNLRKYIVRRKWQKTGNAVRALARLQTLAKLRNGSGATSGGIQSGFVCSLKAQLSRENQPTRPQTSIRIRPRFITNFRNEECVSGSSVVLECSVIGRPKPEVTWLKDGRVINSSGHYRMACEREDMYKLSIRRVTRMDAGTYTCQAVNGAGREEISAHLAVRN